MNVFLLTVACAGMAVVMWRRGGHMWAVGLGGFALMSAWSLLRQLPWPALVLVGVFAVAAAWHQWSRSASLITRWSGRTRRSKGTASVSAIARHASGRALRAKLRVIRPSLAGLSWWELRRVPVIGYGIELCRIGFQLVWVSIEDVTLVFGGPRMGKTGWLACRILDAPGAVVVTSTRTDLLEMCATIRARKGPVWVFNAVGLGGVPSTLTFDPLTGCCDPVTATHRATDMIGAVSKAGSGDREFWDAQARRVLAALLHAAALGGKTMSDLSGWISEPGTAAREVSALLQRSTVPAFAQDATQFLGTNDKTQTSITTTMTLALTWLNNPKSVEAAQPGQEFDVERLLAERATVFLLGAEESPVAPLVCALTGHIAREARRIAATRPRGRLDPPLGLYLDEAFLICPVPLESWTADMGGRNVTIIAVFQSRQQMIDRYGPAKTGQIMTNAAAKVVFGNTGDRDDLIFWSTLAGDRDEPVMTTDLHGRGRSRTVRTVPVMAPAQIMNLPEFRVLVFRRGISPVLGKARMAWKRWDVRVNRFTVKFPRLAALIARCAAAVRRRWAAWVVRPVQAAVAASRAWTTRTSRRVWAAVCRWACSGWVRVVRGVRCFVTWLRSTPWRVPVNPSEAGEVPLPVPSGAPAPPDDEPAGRPWWNP